MKTNSCAHMRSERGVALVIVLLLMAVLSGLATGFAMNGQVEATMAHNEVYYAGARAAAEAGINRATAALRLEVDRNVLEGLDEAVDNADENAAVNADNGDLGLLGLITGAAPYPLGDPNGEYSYSIEVLDDDDPRLYNGTDLTAAQLVAIGNEGNAGAPDPFTDHNARLVLRATGFGPSNTVVRVSRLLLTSIDVNPASTINPAILVDGDLLIDGNIDLSGLEGNVHANGDLTIDGNSAEVSGDATASGDFEANDNFTAGGVQGGGYANVNVPEVTAQDFLDIADYILHSDGNATLADGSTACGAPCSAWSWDDGKWKITGNSAAAGTFYSEASIEISGSPSLKGNQPLEMSLISEGSIKITGSPILTPDTTNNGERIMFVTNGDLFIGGNLDADIPNPQVEGQIFVREQLHMHGNPEFQGRIIVQNDANDFDDVTDNSIGGTPNITYEGTLPGYDIPETTEYTYNVTGWIEQ